MTIIAQFEFGEYLFRGAVLSVIAVAVYLALSPSGKARSALLAVTTAGLLVLPLALLSGLSLSLGWIPAKEANLSESHLLSASVATWTWWQYLWLAGSLLVLSRLLVGGISLLKICRSQTEVPDRVLRIAEEAASDLGMRRAPKVIVVSDQRAPFATGLIRPRILLPEDALNWSSEVLKAVVMHELAHISRRDLWMQCAGNLACAIHWFNPLVWFLHRRLAREREYVADSLVVESGTNPRAYANALLDVASAKTANPPASAIGLAGASKLEERIRRIIGGISNRKQRLQLGRAGAVIAGLFAIAACAWLDPFAQPPAPAPPELQEEAGESTPADWSPEEVEARLAADPFPAE